MRRLARWLLDREEGDRWVPRRALIWAFDYMFAHGRPVTFRVRACRPLIEVNPAPKTWATGNSAVITFPLSSNNPSA